MKSVVVRCLSALLCGVRADCVKVVSCRLGCATPRIGWTITSDIANFDDMSSPKASRL